MGLELAAAGLGASLIGGYIAGNAAENTAEAQYAGAQAQQGQALNFAAMSPTELSMIKTQTKAYRDFLQFQREDLIRQGNLLQQYQGAQGDIMSGKTPGVLSPMEKQFALERQHLASSMKAAGGSGISQSSAGMQQRAMQEQAIGMSRLNALQGLANLGFQTGSAINQSNAMGSSLAQSVFGMENTVKQRQLAALSSVPLYQYAGAGSIAEQMLGSALMGTGNNAMQAGTMGYYANRTPTTFNYNMGSSQPAAGGSPWKLL